MLSRAAARSISASRSLAASRSLSTAAGSVAARGLAATPKTATTTLSQQRRELSGRAADRIDTDRVGALRRVCRARAGSRTRPRPLFTAVPAWSSRANKGHSVQRVAAGGYAQCVTRDDLTVDGLPPPSPGNHHPTSVLHRLEEGGRALLAYL